MDHIANCSTCPHNNASRLPAPASYTCYCQLKQMWVHMYCFNWIRYVGCASHPMALQVMNVQPVIEQLESQKIKLTTYMPVAYREGGTRMLDYAIKLLQGCEV